MKAIGKKSHATLAAELAATWSGYLVSSRRRALAEEITELLDAVEKRAKQGKPQGHFSSLVHRTFDPPSAGDTYTLCGIRVWYGLKPRIKLTTIPEEITCPDCINH